MKRIVSLPSRYPKKTSNIEKYFSASSICSHCDSQNVCDVDFFIEKKAKYGKDIKIKEKEKRNERTRKCICVLVKK